jgi:hypothetical protein
MGAAKDDKKARTKAFESADVNFDDSLSLEEILG